MNGLNDEFGVERTTNRKAAIFSSQDGELVNTMYNQAARERIARSFDLYPRIVTLHDFESGAVDVGEFEVLFGTWGFPPLSESAVAKFSRLKHIFFGAGSIRYFGLPFLKCGVSISSSKATNARVVADFCLAQILLASKRYFQNINAYRDRGNGLDLKDKLHFFAGFNGSKIGLIGCGRVSRFLIDLLNERDFEILVSDPFLSVEESERLGVKKAELEILFRECDVVSNHLPNLPELEGVLKKQHFESMKDGATFLNTGRGAQIREDELIEVLRGRTDLYALLDVTEPEPPELDSALYTLPNILLSSHIAGCVGKEIHLLIEEAIVSSEKWVAGETLENLETLEQFNLNA